MHSLNRLIYLYFGSISFLFLVFIWIAFALDFAGFDNIFVKLSKTKFAGYDVPELFGSIKDDLIGDKVFRLKIVFTLTLLGYSILSLALFSIDESIRRTKLFFLSISFPPLIIIILFWIKFINDNHVVDKIEKMELFIGTASCLILSLISYLFSMRSPRENVPTRRQSSMEKQNERDDSIESPHGNLSKKTKIAKSNLEEQKSLEKLPQLDDILTPDFQKDEGEENIETESNDRLDNLEKSLESEIVDSSESRDDDERGDSENSEESSNKTNLTEDEGEENIETESNDQLDTPEKSLESEIVDSSESKDDDERGESENSEESPNKINLTEDDNDKS